MSGDCVLTLAFIPAVVYPLTIQDLNMNMHTHVQPVTEEEVPTLEECITKISALLRVFTTVIQSLGDSFSASKGGQISREYVYEVRRR